MLRGTHYILYSNAYNNNNDGGSIATTSTLIMEGQVSDLNNNLAVLEQAGLDGDEIIKIEAESPVPLGINHSHPIGYRFYPRPHLKFR